MPRSAAAALARRRADLFQHRVRRRHPDLAVQHARQRHSRHRQHLCAGGGDARRRGAAHSAVGRADLRLRRRAGARRRRRRDRAADLLRRRLAGLRLLPVVRPRRGEAEAPGDAAALAAVPRHPADRPARVADLDHDQRHHRADHRRGRRLRSGGDRRLRRRHAARIPAGSAGVRLRRAAGRAGRHQHRRRQARARAARGLDRRLDLLCADRGDRPRGGAVSGGLARAVRPRSGDDRGRLDLSAHRRAVLRLLRPRHGALFRLAGRGRAEMAAARRPVAPDHRGRRRLSAAALDRQSHVRVCGAGGGAGDLGHHDRARGRGGAWFRGRDDSGARRARHSA